MNRKRDFAIVSMASGIPFILFQGMIYFLMGGTIFSKNYAFHNLLSHSALLALKAVLWSPSRSIFIFNPFLFTLFPLLFIFLKNKKNGNKTYSIINEKRLVSIMFATNVGETVFLLFWPAWWSGHAYGPRIFTDNIFIYLLIFLIVQGDIKKYSWKRENTLLGISFFMFAIGLAVNIQGVYNIHTLEWNDFPNVDIYRKKIIFDWRFPQFMMLHKKEIDRKCLIQSREFGILKDVEVANKMVLSSILCKFFFFLFLEGGKGVSHLSNRS